ncbi:MAG: FtsH protease activity modulator HflK [Candidatus Aminicenantes bacterium]|uniref:Protein HflK n=1 Tax=Candidatus Saccharicenans subterraneus TaxID=2508984 RepID=A0A3E2BN06_9BACT|nr:FtsH protease activity modulator HflK [Candidatus Aminicenantes bacterium]RFT16032.1 MAG: HflK like protein [Candidatus Saccharicenans subterraneum]
MPGEFKTGWSGYDLPRIPGRWLKYAAAAILVIILLATSIYQIKPEEIGVILRFGRFVRTTEPGLHFRLPLGIERLTRVPVQRQLKLEFGYRTARPGVKSEYYVTEETKKESMMLTGDLNVVVAEWIVQYKIKDPYKFLFKVRDPVLTFRAMTEAVVRQVVGDASVDEVITFGRANLAAEAMTALQKLVDTYELGLEINQLIFQDVNPPDPVKPSFNEVNQALQEKERKINEAWAEYNQEIPKAQGEAEQMIRGAEGYAAERVNNARGDAARFISIYREYSKAPVVTRKRLYLETLNEVLAGIDRKIIVDEAQKNLVPLLNLGEEVKK